MHAAECDQRKVWVREDAECQRIRDDVREQQVHVLPVSRASRGARITHSAVRCAVRGARGGGCAAVGVARPGLPGVPPHPWSDCVGAHTPASPRARRENLCELIRSFTAAVSSGGRAPPARRKARAAKLFVIGDASARSRARRTFTRASPTIRRRRDSRSRRAPAAHTASPHTAMSAVRDAPACTFFCEM